MMLRLAEHGDDSGDGVAIYRLTDRANTSEDRDTYVAHYHYLVTLTAEEAKAQSRPPMVSLGEAAGHWLRIMRRMLLEVDAHVLDVLCDEWLPATILRPEVTAEQRQDLQQLEALATTLRVMRADLIGDRRQD
jgi:hypothetical protein